jgi:hypothetical protein
MQHFGGHPDMWLSFGIAKAKPQMVIAPNKPTKKITWANLCGLFVWAIKSVA